MLHILNSVHNCYCDTTCVTNVTFVLSDLLEKFWQTLCKDSISETETTRHGYGSHFLHIVGTVYNRLSQQISLQLWSTSVFAQTSVFGILSKL